MHKRYQNCVGCPDYEECLARKLGRHEFCDYYEAGPVEVSTGTTEIKDKE